MTSEWSEIIRQFRDFFKRLTVIDGRLEAIERLLRSEPARGPQPNPKSPGLNGEYGRRVPRGCSGTTRGCRE
jgi:hypothetical protein